MATYTIDTHATIRELEDAGMDSRQAEVVVAAISPFGCRAGHQIRFEGRDGVHKVYH